MGCSFGVERKKREMPREAACGSVREHARVCVCVCACARACVCGGGDAKFALRETATYAEEATLLVSRPTTECRATVVEPV